MPLYFAGAEEVKLISCRPEPEELTMKNQKTKGQSIVEYIVLIAAVIAALLVFLGKGGVFQKSYEGVISGQGDNITDMSQRIFK